MLCMRCRGWQLPEPEGHVSKADEIRLRIKGQAEILQASKHSLANWAQGPDQNSDTAVQAPQNDQVIECSH